MIGIGLYAPLGVSLHLLQTRGRLELIVRDVFESEDVSLLRLARVKPTLFMFLLVPLNALCAFANHLLALLFFLRPLLSVEQGLLGHGELLDALVDDEVVWLGVLEAQGRALALSRTKRSMGLIRVALGSVLASLGRRLATSACGVTGL